MTPSRLWLALVLALFCLPLFVGLGRTDVGHDEAIYTFAVDRILESDDWLAPRSSPHEDEAFLEKPPLKFWIVAAPIRLGLLPHNEFGTRFWDALFGAIAFGYVLAIGARLAGPVCGAVACLLLFVHWPLLFEHGLRSNNMEGPLFLSYCGGIFHFLAWAAASDDRQRLRHRVAVGLYFVLGFMTKFVAAIFLPAIFVVAALLFRDSRLRFWREWRGWAAVSLLVVGLIAPWFAYATLRFGSYFWEVILAEHVITRFRTYLNPVHVQPWSYYFTEMFLRFGDSGSQWLVVVGFALLTIQAIRRRWFEGTVVCLWFMVPVTLISVGTSKLYHYAYPFLPPLALAAGYLAALVVTLAPVPLDRLLRRLYGGLVARWSAITALSRRPSFRGALSIVAGLAALVAAVSVVYGPVRIGVGDVMLFRSSGVVRPATVVLLFGVLAGASRRASRVVVALVVASFVPLEAYREILPRLTIEQHPMRSATDCLQRIQREAGGTIPGLYVDVPGEFISHPLYYYFRRVRPWTRAASPSPAALSQVFADSGQSPPMLVWDATYRDFMNAQPSRPPSPPMVALPDVVLLLPSAYQSCGTRPLDGSR
jgi:4-amino-4-deoxy-L-arabinose transferase-like glycosyltransferase